MNKQDSMFVRKSIAFITSFTFIAIVSGISVAIAAITFSGTSITGDSSFNSIDTSSTLAIGNATATNITIGRSGQTVSFPGVVTSTGSILFAGGVGIDSVAAGTLLIGNSTTTGITIGRSGQTVTFPGNLSITGPTLFAAGSVIDSSVAGTLLIGNTTTTGITVGRSGQTVTLPGNQLVTGPLLFSATGAIIDSNAAGTLLIGNSTSTGITIGRSTQTVSFPGNASTTGTATFLSTLTQSGGVVSLASTTANGSLTFKSSMVSTSTILDTVSACGGGTPTIAGSNGIGRITTGNNASSTCTISFGTAFANKPVCEATSETTSTINYQITPSTASLVISTASSSAFISNTIDYICIGQ